MPGWLTILLVAIYGVTGALCVLRIIRGPSVLDRIVASDVLLVTLMCALGTEMAVTGHTYTMPILIVLSMFGVVGSFAVSRFLVTAKDPLRDQETDPDLVPGAETMPSPGSVPDPRSGPTTPEEAPHGR